jgi:hypothetical protein
MVLESEGWNVFVQIAISTLISPFMLALGQIDAINSKIRTNEIVWSQPALLILAAELAVMVLSLVIARAVYRRKDSFL